MPGAASRTTSVCVPLTTTRQVNSSVAAEQLGVAVRADQLPARLQRRRGPRRAEAHADPVSGRGSEAVAVVLADAEAVEGGQGAERELRAAVGLTQHHHVDRVAARACDGACVADEDEVVVAVGVEPAVRVVERCRAA